MKKVLVIYATAGIGHKKASLAVKAALDEAGADSAIIDSLDYTNAFFRWTYLKAYLAMVNKLPTFWGIAYFLTDNYFVNLFVSKVRRINNWMNSGRLRRYLIETKPDVIISTHFFASEIISEMKRHGEIASTLITVVTDYRLHAWWIVPYTDMYVVGGEEARRDLLRWKVPPESVKVLGIPVEPVFSKPADRRKVRQDLSLKEGVFTVLVIGGGFGVGPIEDIVKVSDTVSKELQMIVVCGHNESLRNRLEALKPSLTHAVRIFGFVNNVHEYMEVSDILISKSGGITVSESLAKGLPMVVIAPIIGQETRNCGFMVGNGAAVWLNSVHDLKGVIERLASDPAEMKRMKDAAIRVQKPAACYDIAALALGQGKGA